MGDIGQTAAASKQAGHILAGGRLWRPQNTEGLGPQRIPRLLFQSFEVDWRELPAIMRKSASTWRRLNPEYEVRYYDNVSRDAYVHAEGLRFPGLVEAYGQAITGTHKCDIWRALIVYVEGGVYADFDLIALRPLRELIRSDDDAVTAAAHNPLQKFMVYAPRHVLLTRVLENAVVAYQLGARDAQSTAGPASHGTALLQTFGVRQASPAGVIWDLNRQFKIRITSGVTSFWHHKYAGYAKAVKQIAGLDHFANVERKANVSKHPITGSWREDHSLKGVYRFTRLGN